MIPELLNFIKKLLGVAWTGVKNLGIDIYNFFIFLFVRGKQKRTYKYKKRHKYNW